MSCELHVGFWTHLVNGVFVFFVLFLRERGRVEGKGQADSLLNAAGCHHPEFMHRVESQILND